MRPLAAAEQKRMQEGWSKAAPKVVQKVMQAAGLDRPRTNMTFPPEILNHEDGIGAFSHPGEGVEYLLSFNQVVSGMRKRGKDLTVAEAASIHGAITSSSICPAFVHYLVAKHGVESIATAFYLREQPCAMALDVLLHRYKGSHYRRRYPSITLVGVPGKSNP
jgi:hypothetical protein